MADDYATWRPAAEADWTDEDMERLRHDLTTALATAHALLREWTAGEDAGYVMHEGDEHECRYCHTATAYDYKAHVVVYPHTADCLVTRARSVLAAGEENT